MNKQSFWNTLSEFSAAELCSADAAVRVMSSDIRSLALGTKICGPAKTVLTQPAQNEAIHRAVKEAEVGQVLVIESAPDDKVALFGDILARGCSSRGLVGAVIDGAIRDSSEIRRLKFPTFCRSVSPLGPAKTIKGRSDIEITCGGIIVRPGDIVVGDDDGVVIVPYEMVERVARKAAQIVKNEEEIVSRILNGESTYDILGLGGAQHGK